MHFRIESEPPLPVSRICLGTAPFGSQLSEQVSLALLDRYAELGGNFLDTAHVYGAWDKNGSNSGYGNSEVVIGRWLKRTGMRGKFFIGTKGGHPDFDSRASGLSRPILLQHLQESLDRLQTDYIDIYWLHRDDRSIPVNEIIGWLEESFNKGYIRKLGCSHWRTDRLEEALGGVSLPGSLKVESSQIAWSLAEARQPRSNSDYGEQLAMNPDTWNFHLKNAFSLVAYHTQASGFFSEKYDHCDFASADFPNPGINEKYGTPMNLARRTAAQRLAQEKGCSTNQVALAWLLHQPFPTYAIIGPGTIAHLEDSMQSSAIVLSQKECRQLLGIRE